MSRHIEKRLSAIASLKEVVVFLAAITMANGVSVLILEPDTKAARSLAEVKGHEWICLLILIFGVIRFYHGNFRLVDENYLIGPNKGGVIEEHRRNIIWFDYLCIMFMALMFALLSFYISRFSHFIIVYIVIIIIDLFWLYFTNLNTISIKWSSSGISLETSGRSWFYNNVLFIIMLLFFIFIYYTAIAIIDHGYLPVLTKNIKDLRLEDDGWLLWGISSIVFLNSAIDFYYNIQLYFPNERGCGYEFCRIQNVSRIFLAAPFTQLLRTEGPRNDRRDSHSPTEFD